MVFDEEPFKNLSGEPNLFCLLDCLYEPTNMLIEPRQEFPLRAMLTFSQEVVLIHLLCDLSLYYRLYCHAKVGSQTWQSVLSRNSIDKSLCLLTTPIAEGTLTEVY